MKKNSLLFLPLFLICVSCIPQAWDIPDYARTLVKFGGSFNDFDRIEVNVKAPDCVDKLPCKDVTYKFDRNTISNGFSVVKGNKNIIIRKFKDNKLVDEQKVDKVANLGQVLNVDITALNNNILPISTPSPTSTPLIIIVAPTSNSTPTPNPIITPTPNPSPTVTPFFSGGTGGGFNVSSPTPTLPNIQVSASVAPDTIGVK